MQVALRLNEWEQVYHKGNMYELAGCVLQGKALFNINEGNKWVESGAKNFVTYCREVLGIGKSIAHAKINVYKHLDKYLELHPEFKMIPPTRVVNLLPYLTDENKEQLLSMAATVPSSQAFENNLRDLQGKTATDACTEHDFVEIKRCRKCGLKVKTNGAGKLTE